MITCPFFIVCFYSVPGGALFLFVKRVWCCLLSGSKWELSFPVIPFPSF